MDVRVKSGFSAALVLVSPWVTYAQGVVFDDIVVGDQAGVTYRRAPSASEAIWQAQKQLPLFTFDALVASPTKSRGAPGVAVFDYDSDGDLDIYVTNGPGAANSLYANQFVQTGVVQFVDVAADVGVDAIEQDSSGVCYGDLDNDGDPDLMVLSTFGSNRLYENQGGMFVDVTAPAGAAGFSHSSSCAMGDVNGDGLLDIFVANVFDQSQQAQIFVEPFEGIQPNQLLLNVGRNRFADVSESSGILDLYRSPGAPPGSNTITWAVSLVDYDLDGDVDIVQADDQAGFPPAVAGGIDRGFLQLFENDGTGYFTNVTSEKGMAKAGTWMGLAFGDYDRSGTLDLFVTNFGPFAGAVQGVPPELSSVYNLDSRWFLQQDDGFFTDSESDGRVYSPFGWGTSSFDYDNDGDTDIVFHGGLDAGPFVETSPGVVWSNDGSANFVRDVDALAGSTDHNRRTVHGMAVGDLNNDGFVDIVSVSNFDIPEPLPLVGVPTFGGEFDVDARIVPTFTPLGDVVFGDPSTFMFTWNGLVFPDGTLSVEINSADNHNQWAQVELVGGAGLTRHGKANRDGIGAVVAFKPKGGQAVMAPVLGGSSYASQDSLIASFGMGHAQRGVVEVLWPGGVRNRLYGVRAGERVTFPEIPCSYDANTSSLSYLLCLASSLTELHDAGVVDRREQIRFLVSAVRAFRAERKKTRRAKGSKFQRG